MNEQVDELHRQVWRHLQAGEWHSAMAVAESLSKLDEPGGDGGALAKSAGTLARIADAIRLGQPLGNDDLFHLEEMARDWPRLAEALSFRTLVQAAKKAAVTTQLTPRREPVSGRPTPQPHAKLRRKKSRPRLLKRIARPKGWAGIAATVVCAFLIVLVCNVSAQVYLVLQPYSNHGPEADGMRQLLPVWSGLTNLSAPVDTLILGDSAARSDLLSGPIADRLGGTAFQLATLVFTGLLSDAWMLQYYVNKFGPPRNVILLRSCGGYEVMHNLELMSIVPLPWGYWDQLGPAPVWETGEERDLRLKKLAGEFPLYSESDVLSYRLTHPMRLFSQPANYEMPYRNYSRSTMAPAEFGGLLDERPSWLFGPFSPSSDSINALRAMSDLATKFGFQLYIVVGPEWDEAYEDPARQSKVSSMEEWLAQFTNPEYVHLVLENPMVFHEEQMENPNHLLLGAARQYTEAAVAEMVAIQNRLTVAQARPIQMTSAILDKSTYASGEKPALTLLLTANESADPTATVSGTVSGLVRASGKSDGEWTARAQAAVFTVESGKNTEVRMTFGEGEIDEAGVYDLVLFLRQNVGGLSFETRVELPSSIEVK